LSFDGRQNGVFKACALDLKITTTIPQNTSTNNIQYKMQGDRKKHDSMEKRFTWIWHGAEIAEGN
jgi:hypothetical protein